VAERDGLLVLYADGACRGNPGPMGIGAVIYDPDGKVAGTASAARSWGTNNQAEWLAALAALNTARGAGARRVELRMDSELVVRQLNGEYRVKNEGLRPLHERTQELLRGFDDRRCVYVRREGDSDADRLANGALDATQGPATGEEAPQDFA